MINVTKMLLLSLCAFVLVATAVEAQVTGADPVEFSVFLRGDFTDNRDSSETDEEDNFDIYVKPRMDVVMDTDQTLLNLFYEPAYRYRSDPSDAQNDYEWYHDVGLNLRHDPSARMTVKLSEQFNYTDDPSVDEGGSTVRGDRSFILNRVRGGVDFDLSRQLNMELYGRHKTKQYDENEIAETSDEDRTDVGVESWFAVNRTLGLLCEARVSTFGFDTARGVERDFDLWHAGVGFEKVFNRNLRAKATVGWEQEEFDDDGLDDQSELYAYAMVEGGPTPSTRLKAEITRAIRDADAYPYSSQLYTEFYAGLFVEMSERTSLALHGLYRLGDYDDSLPASAMDDDTTMAVKTPDQLQGGDEDTLQAMVELSYELTDQSSVTLMQEYQDVESDVSDSFDKNTTSVVVSYHF